MGKSVERTTMKKELLKFFLPLKPPTNLFIAQVDNIIVVIHLRKEKPKYLKAKFMLLSVEVKVPTKISKLENNIIGDRS